MSEPLARFAFTSCAKFFPIITYGGSLNFGLDAIRAQKQPAWDKILDWNPDLLLMLGDNIYTSGWGKKRVRAAYEFQCNKVNNFRRLLDSLPYLATWDDHDLGKNNAKGDTKKGRKHRDGARELFKKYLPNRPADGASYNEVDGEIYCSYEFNRVFVIVLDGRFYRQKIVEGQDSTFLGAEQEAWLWQQFERAKKGDFVATFVCCGSTIDSSNKKKNIGESVSHFSRFYDEFRQRFSECPTPIFLSGDIHTNAFKHHYHKNGDYAFAEAISSGVNQRVSRGTWHEDLISGSKKISKWGQIYVHEDHVRFNFINKGKSRFSEVVHHSAVR